MDDAHIVEKKVEKCMNRALGTRKRENDCNDQSGKNTQDKRVRERTDRECTRSRRVKSCESQNLAPTTASIRTSSRLFTLLIQLLLVRDLSSYEVLWGGLLSLKHSHEIDEIVIVQLIGTRRVR